MHVYVMRGIPGSGKSTMARAIQQAFAKPTKDGTPDSVIVSADEYFTRRDPVTGQVVGYYFDQHLQGEAHSFCLRNYLAAVTNSIECIIVDNTNSRLTEAAPYMSLGSAYGYTTILFTVNCPVEVALKRNVHDVPVEVIHAMQESIESSPAEPWWLDDDCDQEYVETYFESVFGHKPGELPPEPGSAPGSN